jgi:uncharacterized damage-inducible protein DinB
MAKSAESTGTEEIRKQLVALLREGQAHVTFDDAIADFPAEHRGIVPKGLSHSAWQILEHIRIAQRDILDFSAPPTGGYQPMEWPAAYWPKSPEPSAHAWDASIAAIRKDQASFEALITRPESDLYKAFRWGDGQNLLREALLLADHNAYHLGELVALRRLLGVWEK